MIPTTTADASMERETYEIRSLYDAGWSDWSPCSKAVYEAVLPLKGQTGQEVRVVPAAISETIASTEREERMRELLLNAEAPSPSQPKEASLNETSPAFLEARDTLLGPREPVEPALEDARPTRIWFDTEFIEDGKTIDLISIGMVRQDGEVYYAEFAECQLAKASQWVKDNVLVHLRGPVKSREQIRTDIVTFAGDDPEFWAYYASYDWIALCQLFGTMMDLPRHWPMFCRDLQQLRGNHDLPEQTGTEHHALADAIWTRDAHMSLSFPRTEAAAVAPDAVANLIVRGDGTGVLMGLGGDYLSKLPKGAYPLYTHPAAPSNVREQALEEGFRKGTKEAAKILHSLADRAPPTARDIARSLYRDAARDIEALKLATPDAGKGETT